MNYFKSTEYIRKQQNTAIGLFDSIFLSVASILLVTFGLLAVFISPGHNEKLVVILLVILVLVLTYRQAIQSLNAKRLWDEVGHVFTQEDVDECLGVASDIFFESISTEQTKELSSLVGEKTSDALVKIISEKEKFKRRFWLMHGFFSALNFRLKPKIGDYKYSDGK